MPFTRKFNSYSGSDITALFNNIPFASLQHLQFSISREKARIWTLGSPDPRSFSRGKRSIGGALVFVLFDRNALIQAFRDSRTPGQGGFFTSGDEVRTDFNPTQLNDFNQTVVDSTVFDAFGNPTQLTGGNLVVGGADPNTATTNNFFSASSDPWYADQIPPFQLSVVAANEYGAISTMKLFNVELLEEGSGVGIDDIVIEEQYSFICTGVQPWTVVQESSTGFGQKSDNA